MRTVLECDAIENNRASRNFQRLCMQAVFDPERLMLQPHHLLHFVDAALKIRHMLAHVAKISVHDEIAGQDKSHIAQSRETTPPEDERVKRYQRAQAEQ